MKYITILQRPYITLASLIKYYKAGKPIRTPNKKRKRSRPVRDSVDGFSREAIARYIYQEADNGKRFCI